MSYQLVDEALIDVLSTPRKSEWLLLEESTEFKGHWAVNGFGDDWKYDLDEVLGPYRAVAPSGLAEFKTTIEEAGYKLAFFDDPTDIMEAYDGLKIPPSVKVSSTLPGTVNGMLPYQIQGFNMLKDVDGGVARWDTGTGKTILASALMKYHQESFDYSFFVVKKNNKLNTVRKLLASVGIEAILVKGTKKQRQESYYDALEGARGQVLVMNYEQFKTDFVTIEKKLDKNKNEYTVCSPNEWGSHFFDGRDVFCIWDEMPMKLKNRDSLLYKAICTCLYATVAPKVDWAKKRPTTLRQYMLSATPIENSPEDWFNCVRLLDPRIYGTVSEFRDTYVSSYSYWDSSKPEDWHRLDRMGLKAAHIVHQVDKTDPDIASVFPEVITESLYIDWNKEASKLYKELGKLADKLSKDEESEGLHVLSLINLYQMICDAPEMILGTAAKAEVFESALEAWQEAEENELRAPDPKGSGVALEFMRAIDAEITNKNHAKLDVLHSLITEIHHDEKICVFSRWNAAIMPTLEAALQEWGVKYVRYHGSDKDKQAAQDAFQSDPDVQVFLSSDAGSDSIDLDAGSVVIHYNLPWKWTTYIQRENRIHRATSSFGHVRYYTLLMADSVEDRTREILMQKRGYHDSLFQPIAGVSSSARMSKQDLLYILTGERVADL